MTGVARVVFRAGRRVLRDAAAPFERTLSRRRLARTRAKKLRAEVRAAGATLRLTRTLPRCGWAGRASSAAERRGAA